MRVRGGLLGHADHVEQLPRAELRVGTRQLSDPPGRQRQVVHHGEMRKEVELLEDDPDPLADGRDVGARAVISSPSKKIRPAWIGSSRLTQRRSVLLPLPLGPMITSTSPCGDLEVDPVEDEVRAEALADALEPQQRTVLLGRAFDRGGARRAHAGTSPDGLAGSMRVVIG